MALGNVRPPGVYFLRNKQNGADYDYILDDDTFTIGAGTAIIVYCNKTLRIESDQNDVWVAKIGNVSDQIIGGGIVDVQ